MLLHGNVQDLFPQGEGEQRTYVPIIPYLVQKCAVPGLIVLVYELNGPIRLTTSGGAGESWDKIKSGWMAWRTGVDYDQLILQSLTDKKAQNGRKLLESQFEQNVRDSIGQPTVALEFLRQLTLCSRAVDSRGRAFIPENLLIILEGADLILPVGGNDISNLNAADRQRVTIAQDWFGDPGFMAGGDSVILLAESRSLVHPRVTSLPQLLAVEVAAPDEAERRAYIEWHQKTQKRAQLPGTSDEATLARQTASLSIHALRQLLVGAAHSGQPLNHNDVIAKVEQYIQAQLGEDVVEFKKPEHALDDVIGFAKLKGFIRDELLPRFKSSGPDALPGAAVAGPIGGGKTFIFEAVAAAMDAPVLVIKNIRSQWFGQTDVIFERLRRVLEALGKVLIFVDEADTQFGGVGGDTHETERRLTGKIQAMMSDPKLRGRVVWLLMTARIHRLSPDIRRPGRVGDLIIPILDPEPGSEDHHAFMRWATKPALGRDPTPEEIARIAGTMIDRSAAAFASLRSNLKARSLSRNASLTLEDIEAIVHDMLPPAIEETRRYQTLQALVNCTRRSLLPDPNVTEAQRREWQQEIRALEMRGVD